jgi:hypothetical protein
MIGRFLKIQKILKLEKTVKNLNRKPIDFPTFPP